MTPLIDPDAEAYAIAHTTPFTGATADATARVAAEMPRDAEMMAGVAEARLLQALVALSGATSVLEIGTFVGVGALSLAAALPDGGSVTTLEADPDTAAIARRNFDASPYAERIQLLEGDARQTLTVLPGPFDLVWIDAWKSDYPFYYEAVRDKLSPGGVIAADNVLRSGLVLDPDANDASTAGIRTFNDLVRADPEFDNVLLTIGDGVMLAWRRPATAIS